MSSISAVELRESILMFDPKRFPEKTAEMILERLLKQYFTVSLYKKYDLVKSYSVRTSLSDFVLPPPEYTKDTRCESDESFSDESLSASPTSSSSNRDQKSNVKSDYKYQPELSLLATTHEGQQSGQCYNYNSMEASHKSEFISRCRMTPSQYDRGCLQMTMIYNLSEPTFVSEAHPQSQRTADVFQEHHQSQKIEDECRRFQAAHFSVPSHEAIQRDPSLVDHSEYTKLNIPRWYDSSYNDVIDVGSDSDDTESDTDCTESDTDCTESDTDCTESDTDCTESDSDGKEKGGDGMESEIDLTNIDSRESDIYCAVSDCGDSEVCCISQSSTTVTSEDMTNDEPTSQLHDSGYNDIMDIDSDVDLYNGFSEAELSSAIDALLPPVTRSDTFTFPFYDEEMAGLVQPLASELLGDRKRKKSDELTGDVSPTKMAKTSGGNTSLKKQAKRHKMIAYCKTPVGFPGSVLGTLGRVGPQ